MPDVLAHMRMPVKEHYSVKSEFEILSSFLMNNLMLVENNNVYGIQCPLAIFITNDSIWQSSEPLIVMVTL